MNPKDLLELQKVWLRKLKESGFKDIETDERGALKRWDSLYFYNRFTPEQAEAASSYYRLAAQLVHDVDWPDKLDKQIWTLHSEGYSVTEILTKVKSSRKTIERRIKHYSRLIRI